MYVRLKRTGARNVIFYNIMQYYQFFLLTIITILYYKSGDFNSKMLLTIILTQFQKQCIIA